MGAPKSTKDEQRDLHRAIEENTAEQRALIAQPRPKGDVLPEFLEALARTRDRIPRNLFESWTRFATEGVERGSINPSGMLHVETGSPFAGVLPALVADALAVFVEQRLDEFYAANPPGLREVERQERLHELEMDRLELEVAEELLIRRASDMGVALDRRVDCDMEVVFAKGPRLLIVMKEAA